MGQVEVLAQENLPHMNALGSRPSTGGGGRKIYCLEVTEFQILGFYCQNGLQNCKMMPVLVGFLVFICFNFATALTAGPWKVDWE